MLGTIFTLALWIISISLSFSAKASIPMVLNTFLTILAANLEINQPIKITRIAPTKLGMTAAKSYSNFFQ